MSTFTLSGVVTLAPKWIDGNATASDSLQTQLLLANGTGAGQADSYYRASITVDNDDSHELDLTALPVSSLGGTGTLYLASVKTLMIRNTSDRTAIQVDDAATNAWSACSPGTIGPSSLFMLHEGAGGGRPVGSTSKILALVNADATVSKAGTAAGTAITGLANTTGLYAGMLLGATHPSGAKIATVGTTSVTTTAAATANGAATFDFIPPPVVLDVLVVGVLD